MRLLGRTKCSTSQHCAQYAYEVGGWKISNFFLAFKNQLSWTPPLFKRFIVKESEKAKVWSKQDVVFKNNEKKKLSRFWRFYECFLVMQKRIKSRFVWQWLGSFQTISQCSYLTVKNVQKSGTPKKVTCITFIGGNNFSKSILISYLRLYQITTYKWYPTFSTHCTH